MPDVAGVPSAEKLAALLAEACRVIAGLTARADLLERRAGRDSSTSSKPPSDSPYRKKSRGRSLPEQKKRRPRKQPGERGEPAIARRGTVSRLAMRLPGDLASTRDASHPVVPGAGPIGVVVITASGPALGTDLTVALPRPDCYRT